MRIVDAAVLMFVFFAGAFALASITADLRRAWAAYKELTDEES